MSTPVRVVAMATPSGPGADPYPLHFIIAGSRACSYFQEAVRVAKASARKNPDRLSLGDDDIVTLDTMDAYTTWLDTVGRPAYSIPTSHLTSPAIIQVESGRSAAAALAGPAAALKLTYSFVGGYQRLTETLMKRVNGGEMLHRTWNKRNMIQFRIGGALFIVSLAHALALYFAGAAQAVRWTVGLTLPGFPGAAMQHAAGV